MQKVQLGTATLYHGDCMDVMAMLDEKFELAISDPPYFTEKNYLSPGCNVSTTGVKRVKFDFNHWQVPDAGWLSMLLSVSDHQIIWGANYYPFFHAEGRIIWDKKNDTSSFSHAEIASVSLHKGVRMFRYLWNGMLQEDMRNKEKRIHPCQKPVALYEWLLTNYAKSGDKILDTHLGSGSSAIAANKLGFEFVGIELDKDYFDAACKRIDKALSQQDLFAPQVAQNLTQTGMFE